jgi:hypothetical protein
VSVSKPGSPAAKIGFDSSQLAAVSLRSLILVVIVYAPLPPSKVLLKVSVSANPPTAVYNAVPAAVGTALLQYVPIQLYVTPLSAKYSCPVVGFCGNVIAIVIFTLIWG